MINPNNAEISIKTEVSNIKNIEDHDLYKFITPPIPLIPKNKYSDDLPRSYFLML